MGAAAALGSGALIARGSSAVVLLAVGAVAFLLWAIESAEHAALVLIAVTPFSIYPATVGGLSIFLVVPLLGLTSVILLLRQPGTLGRLWRRLPVLAFGVLIAVAALSSALSSEPKTAGSRWLYLVVFGFLAAALASAMSRGRLSQRAVARAVVFAAATGGIAVIVQVLAQFTVGAGGVTSWLSGVLPLFAGERAAGYTGQLNWTIEGLDIVRGIFPFMSAPSAGQFLMFGLIAAVWLRRERDPSSGLRVSLELTALGVIVAALLLTFSRQSWIGAFVGLGALALRRRPLWMFGVILGLFAVMTAVPAPGTQQSFADYLLNASNTSTSSTGQRLDLWTQSFKLLPSHWAIGVGPGLYSTLSPDPTKPIYYAHNVFLDELVELGVAGGLALLALLVTAMTSAFRRSALLGLAMLAAWTTANLFDDELYSPRSGVILAAAFALAAAGERSPGPGTTATANALARPQKARGDHEHSSNDRCGAQIRGNHLA